MVEHSVEAVPTIGAMGSDEVAVAVEEVIVMAAEEVIVVAAEEVKVAVEGRTLAAVGQEDCMKFMQGRGQ